MKTPEMDNDSLRIESRGSISLGGVLRFAKRNDERTVFLREDRCIDAPVAPVVMRLLDRCPIRLHVRSDLRNRFARCQARANLGCRMPLKVRGFANVARSGNARLSVPMTELRERRKNE